MRKFQAISCLSIVAWLLFASPLSAAEMSISLAPIWWQYEESSGPVPGFAATPLRSSSRGSAIRTTAAVGSSLTGNWYSQFTFEAQLPFSRSDEQWQMPSSTQQNRLSIYQFETRIDQSYRFAAIEAGVWLSYLWHRQRRSSFVVNGVAIVVAGEPVVETIQSYWGGVNLKARMLEERLQTHVEVALPLSVRTTNSLLTDVFTRNRGFRAGVGLQWILLRSQDGVRLSGSAAYRYRELGNDLKATALWPKNRWQEISLGMSLAW